MEEPTGKGKSFTLRVLKEHLWTNLLFYIAFKMALIHFQFVRRFNASLLDAMHASPFSA